MFEAVIFTCLSAAPEVCRPVLQPGFEARTRAACEASMPDGAVCRPLGPALAVKEVAPGLWVHLGDIAEWTQENGGDVGNIAFVVGETSVAAIDAGSTGAIGEALWRAIRKVTDLPVSHVIVTHMHPDHALGAAPLVRAGAQVIGADGLDRALADRAENYLQSLATLVGPTASVDSGPVAVDVAVAVADRKTLNLGGRVLDVRAWDMAHTGTDLTVLDRETGILIAGDLVFDLHVPALDGSLRGWQDALQEMAAMDLSGVVPGHGGPLLDWPAGSTAIRGYLDALAEGTRAALDDGVRLAEAARTVAADQAEDWALFEAFHPRNVTVAFTELEWE